MRNYVYPGNVVSWKFDAPATGQSVGILVPEGTPDHIKIIAYNLDSVPVKAKMTGWEIDPGKWEITQGVQGASAEAPLSDVSTRTEEFERSRDRGDYVSAACHDCDRVEAGSEGRAVLVAA